MPYIHSEAIVKEEKMSAPQVFACLISATLLAPGYLANAVENLAANQRSMSGVHVDLVGDSGYSTTKRRPMIHGYSSMRFRTVASTQKSGGDQEAAQYSDPKFRGDGQSGIQGSVVAWPISPVSRPGESNTRPLAHAILTVQPAGSGEEVMRQRADAQGRFRIALAPGTYQIVALAPQPTHRGPGGGKPATVTVLAGQWVDIILYYDTGIR
jgi:hypothetical protein